MVEGGKRCSVARYLCLNRQNGRDISARKTEKRGKEERRGKKNIYIYIKEYFFTRLEASLLTDA